MSGMFRKRPNKKAGRSVSWQRAELESQKVRVRLIMFSGADHALASLLTGKTIAIDDNQSASNGNAQRAIAAAGATEVRLSVGQAKALDRMISGEVPAAVLTLAYP
jgi:hypothetical protein